MHDAGTYMDTLALCTDKHFQFYVKTRKSIQLTCLEQDFILNINLLKHLVQQNNVGTLFCTNIRWSDQVLVDFWVCVFFFHQTKGIKCETYIKCVFKH